MSAPRLVEDIGAALDATIERISPTDVVYLCDRHTAAHCLPVLGDRTDGRLVVSIPPGEANKTLATCHTVWSALLRHGLDRHGLVVNLGGGVVTDLGGFCAATWKRGVRFVQVPTSLLAMVDASVGGKTGVDLHAAKNQVGVFAQPEAVLIAPGFLGTLPRRHMVAGIAEMIKHGLIADVDHLEAVLNVDVDATGAVPSPLIERSVAIKRSVVADDVRESGRRKVLNLGHTAGHALESMALDTGQDLLHGEAVVWGLLAEMTLGAGDLGAWPDRLRAWMMHHGIPRPAFDRSTFLHHLGQDKKNRGGEVLAVLLEAPTRPVIDRRIAPDQLADAMADVLQTA